MSAEDRTPQTHIEVFFHFRPSDDAVDRLLLADLIFGRLGIRLYNVADAYNVKMKVTTVTLSADVPQSQTELNPIVNQFVHQARAAEVKLSSLEAAV